MPPTVARFPNVERRGKGLAFKCRECKSETDVRLAVLDGYDTVRASFPVPLSEAHQDAVCSMEDRGGGELYRLLLCRNCRRKDPDNA